MPIVRLTLCLLGMVSLPLDHIDVLHDGVLVKLLRQHLGRLTVVITTGQQSAGHTTLCDHELEAGQVTLHGTQVYWYTTNRRVIFDEHYIET